MPAATNEVRRRRLLSAMGIDVWVVRGATPPAADPEVSEPAATRVAGTAAAAAPRSHPIGPSDRTRVTPAARLNLDLTAVSGGGAVIVSDVHDAADRKLVQGVFVALAGGTATSQATRFIWPAPGLADESAEALRNAYRAFLRGQGSRAGATRIVLLGAAATVMPVLDLQDADLEGIRVFTAPTPSVLRADPSAKRALWLQIAALPKA